LSRRKPILVYLPGGESLAKSTKQILGLDWGLIPAEVKYFPDGECKVVLPRGEKFSVRGADTYLIQTPEPDRNRSPQDHFMELVSAVALLTESGACYRTAVIPWYAFACQDKKRQRECLTAKLVADFLEVAGATHIITVDVHNDAIEGFFDRCRCTFNGLYASSLMLAYLDEAIGLLKRKEEFALSAVDSGGSSRILHLAKETGIMPVLPFKVRNYDNGKVAKIIINEEVEGKIAVIFDDMIRSASSIVPTCEALKTKGAKDIYIAATHADFCGEAVALLDKLAQDGVIKKAVFTDSFNISPEFTSNHPWFIKTSLDQMLAQAISSLHLEKPVSGIYLDDK